MNTGQLSVFFVSYKINGKRDEDVDVVILLIRAFKTKLVSI